MELKSRYEVELMRAAGRVVARTLEAVRQAAHEGVSLRELDRVAASVIADAGGLPTFLNYKPRFAPSAYPATICSSVNDVIVHGIPDDYRLKDGDLLGVDCAAHLEGYCADSAISFVVGGEGTSAAHNLIEAAREALAAAIEVAKAGAHLGDVSAAVGRIGRRSGYGIPAHFGGHGIGRQMHEPPSVPNDGEPGRGLVLEPGLVIAIEPMFMAGGDDRYTVDEDGWALRTIDGSLAAHVEHTVAITDGDAEILTLLD